ncbi:MAG: hypothetical protein VW736_05620 [Alphaproteobacteria bacterium]
MTDQATQGALRAVVTIFPIILANPCTRKMRQFDRRNGKISSESGKFWNLDPIFQILF